MKSKILGTHHISIKPAGEEAFERTLYFYHEVLGMPFVRRWGTGKHAGAMLDTGGSRMEITADGDGKAGTGSICHFALSVEDVDAVVEEVRKAGYPIIVEPKDVELPTQPPYSIRIAFCTGPCGEEIEFFLEKE